MILLNYSIGIMPKIHFLLKIYKVVNICQVTRHRYKFFMVYWFHINNKTSLNCPLSTWTPSRCSWLTKKLMYTKFEPNRSKNVIFGIFHDFFIFPGHFYMILFYATPLFFWSQSSGFETNCWFLALDFEFGWSHPLLFAILKKI